MKWLLGAVLLAVACGMNPPPPPPGSGAAGTGTGPTGSADAGSAGPSSSATPEQLTSGESAGGNITLDDRNVYWAYYENAGGWKHWHYTVRAVPKTGGAPVTLAEGAGAMLSAIVAQGGFVYWVMATCPQDCGPSPRSSAAGRRWGLRRPMRGRNDVRREPSSELRPGQLLAEPLSNDDHHDDQPDDRIVQLRRHELLRVVQWK